MRTNIRRWFAPLAIVVGLIVASPQLQAQIPVLPGGAAVVPPSGYSPSAGATIFNGHDTGYQNWNVNLSDTGSVRELVLAGDTNNTLGGLDFVYQITVRTGNLATLSGSNFGAFLTNVAQNPTGPAAQGWFTGTQGAANANRSADGNVVNFNFSPTLSTRGNTISFLLYILTNAQNDMAGNIGIIDSGGTTNSGFAPAPTTQGIPEPTSFVILASCFLGLCGAYSWMRWKGAPTPA